MAVWLALLNGMLFFVPSACGVVIRDDQPDSAYLDLANLSVYSSVGSFAATFNGSGVLIAPDWVLTAAHLLDFANSGTFTIDATTYASSQFIKDPAWNGNVLDGHDIGLVHLNTPVSSVTPALLYTGSSEWGQVGTFVGYGMTGTGLTGETGLDYQKRAFQNMIDGDIGRPALVFAADFDNPHSAADNQFGDTLPLPLEGAAGNGDSGGGVFITVGGQDYLAGVISVVAATDGQPNGDYGDITAFGRVSALAPWIESYVPEPAPPILVAAGGLLLLVFRQRGLLK